MSGAANGRATSGLLEAARRYTLERGWALTPVVGKRPVLAEWQLGGRTVEQLAGELGPGRAIGRLNGAPSGGAVDVDLDAPEAVSAGEVLLPSTDSVWGRAGAERSHWQYRCDPLVPTLQLDDPAPPEGAKARLVELRSTGTQSVVPPSPHPEHGRYRWMLEGEAALIDGRVLTQHVERVGAAALLARHWPSRGSRHTAALALAGALLRAEWDREDAEEFMRAVARAANDEEADDRVAAVRTTLRRLASEGDERGATGLTRLKETFDPRVVERVVRWLGLPEERGVIILGGRRIGGPVEDAEESPAPALARPWPEPMGEAAFRGLPGEIVRAVEPYTEADPHAILVSLLTAFGCQVGPRPHFMVGATRHPARLFTLLIGASSWARKGTSWDVPAAIATSGEAAFVPCIQKGLSSGEGLIWAVRDPVYGIVKGEEALIDKGVEDKRLLLVETEFGSVLIRLRREMNTLSAVLREAWDGSYLSVKTKQPLTATGAHIAMLVHITPTELRARLDDGDVSNGFANRFLWVMIRRARKLSDPPPFDGQLLLETATAWRNAVQRASRMERVPWSPEASELWATVYDELEPLHEGRVADLTARSAAQISRLALIYALFDGSASRTVEHLTAALEVWGYSERCVEALFGDAVGGNTEDVIVRHLRRIPSHEMDASDVYRLFSGRIAAYEVHEAMEGLERAKIVTYRREPTKGAPRHVWTLVREAR